MVGKGTSVGESASRGGGRGKATEGSLRLRNVMGKQKLKAPFGGRNRPVTVTKGGALAKVAPSAESAASKRPAAKKQGLTAEELKRVATLEVECLMIMNQVCNICRKVARHPDEFEWALCTIVTTSNRLDPNESSVVHLSQLSADSTRTFDYGDKAVGRRVSILIFLFYF
jgi:hypothetical protein